MKVYILTKKRLLIALSVLAVSCACLLAISEAAVSTVSGTGRLLPIYSVETDKKQIAITFDAAWGNDDVDMLIDTLAKYDAKATFFVVGDWVRKFPESVKKLHDAGHSIQNHSDTHKAMPDISTEQKLEEITACNEAISQITGQTPEFFRPPSGDYDNATIEAADSLNMYSIQWDVDSLDWKDLTPEDICDRVISRVGNGSIILFHCGLTNTPEALPSILDKLSAEGYSFVSVDELIYRDNYTIDHTGRQFPSSSDQ